MRIALTHNLRVTDSEEEAEFDAPETIAVLVREQRQRDPREPRAPRATTISTGAASPPS